MPSRITYPAPLKRGDLIAVTAPSAGVEEAKHPYLHQARRNVEAHGFRIIEGDTVWTLRKLVSAPAAERAAELQKFLLDPTVRAVIPPWGGEHLIDILPLLDWERLQAQPPPWLLGYSDISTLLFAYTLRTGNATVHGTNYYDLSNSVWDPLTARWLDVLTTAAGGTVEQASSTHHQTTWTRKQPGDNFNLDQPTRWELLGSEEHAASETRFTGRLLGGCLETVSSLVGTPYAPVQSFVHDYCREDGVIWYLESSERHASDIYRHLWQMKHAGWFAGATGFLIGRPDNYADSLDFTLRDALQGALGDLGVPVVYNCDIGHLPPQLNLVNGALADIRLQHGQGTVAQTFV